MNYVWHPLIWIGIREPSENDPKLYPCLGVQTHGNGVENPADT